jgi:DNA repair exonuclease SbcCD ATPase subunit
MSTITEFREDYTKTRAALAELDSALQAERIEIERTANQEGRHPNATEQARLEEIRQEREALQKKIEELDEAALLFLQHKISIDDLLERITSINADLNDTITSLKTAEKHAATLAAIAAAFAKIATTAAGLR